MNSPPKANARRLTGRRARRNLIEPQGYAHPACAQVEARAAGCQDENAGPKAKEEQILFGFANEISLSPKKRVGAATHRPCN